METPEVITIEDIECLITALDTWRDDAIPDSFMRTTSSMVKALAPSVADAIEKKVIEEESKARSEFNRRNELTTILKAKLYAIRRSLQLEHQLRAGSTWVKP